ncbi:hypothetical protein [Sphingobium lignivorans]|uniref:Lipoprotein n=1 Tax=Sphingobium lignivorans TaxID=2735886 RepID=A0ABR6NHW4_9SPHN|nr:hypothetical protein [Sphingobium lignivorans]MBB5986880.1 hypothetical protein [Sphingobium lignivorans]
MQRPPVLIATMTAAFALSACNQQTASDVDPAEGPGRGNVSTDVINQVQGGGGPDEIPLSARPGPAGSAPLAGPVDNAAANGSEQP